MVVYILFILVCKRVIREGWKYKWSVFIVYIIKLRDTEVGECGSELFKKCVEMQKHVLGYYDIYVRVEV